MSIQHRTEDELKIYHNYYKAFGHDKKTNKYLRLNQFLSKDPKTVVTDLIHKKCAGYININGSGESHEQREKSRFNCLEKSKNIYSVLYYRHFSVLWGVFDEISKKCPGNNNLDLPISIITKFLYGEDFSVRYESSNGDFLFIPKFSKNEFSQKFFDFRSNIYCNTNTNFTVWYKNNNLAAKGEFMDKNFLKDIFAILGKLEPLRTEFNRLRIVKNNICTIKATLTGLVHTKNSKYCNKLIYYNASKTIGLEFHESQIFIHETKRDYLIIESDIMTTKKKLYDNYREKSIILSRISAFRRLELICMNVIKKIGSNYFLQCKKIALKKYPMNGKLSRASQQLFIIMIYVHKINRANLFPEIFCNECCQFEPESVELCNHICDHIDVHMSNFSDMDEMKRKVCLLNCDVQYHIIMKFIKKDPNHEQKKYITNSKFYGTNSRIYNKKLLDCLEACRVNDDILMSIKEKYDAMLSDYKENKRLCNIEKRKRKKQALIK
jgi:hypothetical protein